ncbi:MAG: DUF4974 domain-containing protein [Bacteroidales bacterium]
MTSLPFDANRLEAYFRGTDAGPDEAYVREVFSDKNNEKALKEYLSRQFHELGREGDEQSLDHILHRIHYEINTNRKPNNSNRMKRIGRWAAAVAAAILIPLAFFLGTRMDFEPPGEREALVEIQAPAWTRVRFRLPDGTSGWLNGNSKISYQGDFKRDRRVELDGEAYFNVARDPKRPFSVSTANLAVEVLGTRFNMASYQNENTVEVVLEEGSLALSGHNVEGSVHLKPNDCAVYDKASGVLTSEVVNPQKYTAWKDGKLIFRNDPLDVIARRLGRWYNVDIVLNVSSPEEVRWRATFEDDSLEEVLKMMKRSLRIDYEIARREVGADDTIGRRKVILSRMRK